MGILIIMNLKKIFIILLTLMMPFILYAKKPQLKKGAKFMENIYAEFDTTQGKIKIKLFSDKAPKTVANFVGLAEGTKEFTDPKTGKKMKHPFYDGLIFHRVIPDFMIQGGDPRGTG